MPLELVELVELGELNGSGLGGGTIKNSFRQTLFSPCMLLLFEEEEDEEEEEEAGNV